jgi:hypothetical protein
MSKLETVLMGSPISRIAGRMARKVTPAGRAANFAIRRIRRAKTEEELDGAWESFVDQVARDNPDALFEGGLKALGTGDVQQAMANQLVKLDYVGKKSDLWKRYQADLERLGEETVGEFQDLRARGPAREAEEIYDQAFEAKKTALGNVMSKYGTGVALPGALIGAGIAADEYFDFKYTPPEIERAMGQMRGLSPDQALSRWRELGLGSVDSTEPQGGGGPKRRPEDIPLVPFR